MNLMWGKVRGAGRSREKEKYDQIILYEKNVFSKKNSNWKKKIIYVYDFILSVQSK